LGINAMLTARRLKAGDGLGVNGLKPVGLAVAPLALIAARIHADSLKAVSELTNASIESGDSAQMLIDPSQDVDRDLKLFRQGVKIRDRLRDSGRICYDTTRHGVIPFLEGITVTFEPGSSQLSGSSIL
jgi:hypothetical protein